MGKRGVLACQGWSRGAGRSSVILIIRKVTDSSGVAGGGAQGPVTPAGAALCGDYKWEGPEPLQGCCQGRRACPRSSRDLRPETRPGRSSAGRLCCVWGAPLSPTSRASLEGLGGEDCAMERPKVRQEQRLPGHVSAGDSPCGGEGRVSRRARGLRRPRAIADDEEGRPLLTSGRAVWTQRSVGRSAVAPGRAGETPSRASAARADV